MRSSALIVLLAAVTLAAPESRADEALRARAQAAFGTVRTTSVADGPLERLGRQLFFDTRLGADGRTGCVSCHLPSEWGADGRPLSPDARGKLTERNSPTVFDVAALPALRWRGDRRSAAHQAEDSIKGSMGYAASGDMVPVLRSLDYADAFARAFPAAADAVTPANFAVALEAYQRTLVTRAPLDGWLAGDERALTDLQTAGLRAFLDRGCAGCHGGPGLGGTAMRRFGLVRDYWLATRSRRVDVGREAVTKQAADRYVFRVPVLRNVAKTAPYFHDGSVEDLRDAVRIMAELQLGTALPGAELDALVAFLQALTGDVPTHFALPPASGKGR